MGSSAILRRWISRSRAAGFACRSLRDYSSTGTSISLDSCASSPHPAMTGDAPPWSMLEVGEMVHNYKFGRLAGDSVFSLNKGISDDASAAEVVGCSHGWVALFNRGNNDLFLSHPLSHRHIKLPPLHSLPDPRFNTDVNGQWIVWKVILSSSPDEEECRAMMSYGPGKRLAFCLPGRSSDWTPIGDIHIDYYDHHIPWVQFAKVHDDLVYRSRRKIFTSVTPCNLKFPGLNFKWEKFEFVDDKIIYDFLSESYNWDIQDPASPKMVRSGQLVLGNDEHDDAGGVPRGRTRIWWEENRELLETQCIHIPQLVYAEEWDRLFLVMRFVMLMNPNDGTPLGYIPHCEVKGLIDVFPCKTFGFIVMEVNDDEDEESRCTVVEDLNGMSMFVGINHSFAIPSSQQLQPNSIYFTDANKYEMLSGVDDTGVFDYENKTISPLCTPPNRC